MIFFAKVVEYADGKSKDDVDQIIRQAVIGITKKRIEKLPYR